MNKNLLQKNMFYNKFKIDVKVAQKDNIEIEKLALA